MLNMGLDEKQRVVSVESQGTKSMPSIKQSVYILLPCILVLAFNLYYQPAIVGSGNRLKSSEDQGFMTALPSGLWASEIKAHESQMQQLLQEMRSTREALAPFQDKLNSFFSLAKDSLNRTADASRTPEGQAAKSENVKPRSRARRKWTSTKQYTFWSSDFHIAPIADLKDIFLPMGMKIIDKSLSGHCHMKGTCQTDLKVINLANGLDLAPCPNKLRRDFFDAYKNDPEMKTVDAFLCNHACSLCEVFMSFNKSLIVIASTRFEIGHMTAERWNIWNENLRRIAANPRNVVAANNVYDAEYIKYFTGLKDVPVLPNYCGYTGVTYAPERPEILVGPGREVHGGLFQELKAAGEKSGMVFARLRDLYPRFEYSDLVKHKAIVLIPYQVSIMSIFEYYRMGIPMFAPSPALLAKWQLKYMLMVERTWNGVHGHPEGSSMIGPAPGVTVPYDPNNEKDEDAIRYWVSYADYYQWPYIPTFDSWDDLIEKLKSTDLEAQSKLIQAHNEKTKEDLKEDWQDIFARIFDGLPPAAETPREQLMDYDESMTALYKVKVNDTCVGDTFL